MIQQIRILYVDDEVNNLVSFKASFRRSFKIFTASSANEGMDILGKEDIHVIITDQRMPVITGVSFLESVIKKYPDPVRILMTGYSDIEAIIDAINKAQVFKCIAKPWNDKELLKSINEAYGVYCRNKEKNNLIQQLELANKQMQSKLRLNPAA